LEGKGALLDSRSGAAGVNALLRSGEVGHDGRISGPRKCRVCCGTCVLE
jgi:hypothetical protein